jgi:hypothetical protein
MYKPTLYLSRRANSNGCSSVDRSPGKARRKLGLLLAAGSAVLMGISLAFSSSAVTGVVISGETGEPVVGAMVYVQSALPFEEDGLSDYATTDLKGEFRVRTRGAMNALRAWKPGYALRKVPVDQFPESLRTHMVIRLRRLTQTNWVAEHHAFLYGFKSGDGFSFALGEPVSADNPQADIVLTQDATGATCVEALGRGGLLYQPANERIDLYNSPEAPSDGYVARLRVRHPTPGFLFARARDGIHYAKFALLVEMEVSSAQGTQFEVLEGSELVWAFQPDGTTNLETAPGKDMLFPVEAFGIRRETLGQ